MEILVFFENLLIHGVGQEVSKSHDGPLPVETLHLWPGILTIPSALPAQYTQLISGCGFRGGQMLTNNF